jgi:hypothetical protein
MSIIVLTNTRFKVIKPLVCDIINGGVRHTDIYQKLTNIQHAVGVDKKKNPHMTPKDPNLTRFIQENVRQAVCF